MKKFLENFSYAVISNLISFIISALVTLIVPKFLNIESYGYFQLYIFYLSYTGFCCLGWVDGIVLRFGGAYYEDLDKKNFGLQFKIYSFIQFIFGIVVLLLSLTFVHDTNKQLVYNLLGISIILSLPCTYFRYLLQAVNRIALYSKNILIEKIFYIALIIIALALYNQRINFTVLIIADLAGKLLALFHILYFCRDIVFAKPGCFSDALSEGKKNISVGIKLLAANGASLFIVGIIRYAIQVRWDMVVFAKISLSLSVSNMFMVFIRAVSIVIFPMLRRTDKDKLPELYTVIRAALMIPLFGLLIGYYPIKLILMVWLPEYSEALSYMALLFPICIFESKTSMLIETYMKTLRQEKWLLKINILTVVLSAIFTGVVVFYLKNLELAIILLVFLLGFRCICSELVVEKALNTKLKYHILLEVTLVTIFMFASWYIGEITGLVIYFVAYILYLYLERKDILNVIKYIKKQLSIRR